MKPKATSSGTKTSADETKPIAVARAPEPKRLTSSVRRRPNRSVMMPPARIETTDPKP